MKKEIFKIVLLVVLGICCAFFIKQCVGFCVKVRGSSMNPNYSDGDMCIALSMGTIDRGDVVVIDTSKLNNSIAAHSYLIKRVIGLPGDEICIKDGNVYVNGTLYKEDYILHSTTASSELSDVKLGAGEYYVLGDNRPVSKDSRYLGSIPRMAIKGIVVGGKKEGTFVND